MTSADDQTDVVLADADQLWELLAERLETFVEAWETNPEPTLGDHLPEAPPELRRLALIEMIKVDLDYRWQRDPPGPLVEDYATDLPELEADGGLPVDLVYEEYHIRRRVGDQVDGDEYFDRFPGQETQLRRLLGIESPEVSTALFTASRPDDINAGDQLDEFNLLAQLGKGAFANVFLARQESMQRLVALKISADQGTEPQTLAQLDHPHIVRVYDQRIVSDRRLRLLYMKYVAGGTLQDAVEWSRQYPRQQLNGKVLIEAVDQSLDRRGESPPLQSPSRQTYATASWWETVCHIGAQLASALDYAHDRGVLHRDLKPANILLTSEAAPQLVDFNISFCSKIAGATPAAYFGGSLAYMSPEQLEACDPNCERLPESLTGQSDVYSLGVVLWELLTGRRPFEDKRLEGNWSGTLEQMIEWRRRGPDRELLDQLPFECPESLKQILTRCLQANITERYADAAELAADLQLCLHPEAQELLRPASHSPSHWLRNHAVIVLLAVVLVPNALAGWFNFDYNFKNIVERLGEESRAVFMNIVFVVNSIVFPLGIIVILKILWPALMAAKRGPPDDAPLAKRLRRRTLRMGHDAALVCIALWLAAGLVFPVSMHVLGAPLSTTDYIHFLSSMAMCGIIAAAYPFFGATVYALHVLYPAQIKSVSAVVEDTESLSWVERAHWYYFALGFLLPMFGVVILVTMGDEGGRFSLIVLSVGSLLGCALLFLYARRLQRDLATLDELAQLGREQGR